MKRYLNETILLCYIVRFILIRSKAKLQERKNTETDIDSERQIDTKNPPSTS